MNNNDFKDLLKKANLSKTNFAKNIGTSSQVVNNWTTTGREIPYWVKSWLENYIKAQSYNDIKNKIYEIESIKDKGQYLEEDIDRILKEQECTKLLIKEQSQEIKSLRLAVESLLKVVTLYPSKISLSSLAKDLNKPNQTIRQHLISKYEPDKDFKKEDGTIMININIVPLIKEYYRGKSKI